MSRYGILKAICHIVGVPNKLEFSEGYCMLILRVFEDDDLQLLDKWLHKEYIKKWFEVPGICTIEEIGRASCRERV